MGTILNPGTNLFLAGINQIEQRLSKAEREVTSGIRISFASDAPDQLDTVLQIRSDQAQNQQVQTNLGLAQTDAQSADTVLSSAIQLLDSATQLGAQGANSTQTAESRAAMGSQVESLLSQMVSLSQTQVQGRYIFSGDSDQSPSYQLDLSAPNGVDQLSNAVSTRLVQDPAGGSFQASQTAQQIFDSRNADGTFASDNVFSALSSLRTALLNNDQAGVTSALSSVKLASTSLNSSQSFYGTVENRISAGTQYAQSYDTRLATELSSAQDADVTSDALILTQANTQLQAAFESQAKMPTQTMFSFLG
jgi:flagellar hook-associated protein 3 FlgL